MKKKITKNETYKGILKHIKWLGDNAKSTFCYLAGINRPIYPCQVTRIADSINLMGIVRPVIIAELDFITGKKQKYIIDGQHLFNALIRNGMDIPYVTIVIKDKQELVETIAKLNASSKNWSLADYIIAWGSLIPDYVKLNHYFQVYDLDLSILSSVLNDNSSDGGNITRRIKSGTFRIINEQENVKVLDQLTDVLKIVPRMNRMENRYLCREYIRFCKNYNKYNHAKFMKNLEKNKDQFAFVTQEEGKLKELFLSIS
jgi:hypothetical protein